LRDPYTNQVIGSMNLTTSADVQNYLEDMIIEEKARELAFEGERFYDLMRVAQRRMKTDYDKGKRFLADKVAARYSEAEKAMMHERLMDEKNWYLPFYIGTEAIEQ
jgi:starch-binding outer membrane protein, SusD/RagB family